MEEGGGGAAAGAVAGGGIGPRELDQTPTWAVASVAAVIILISILLEKVLHRFGQWFRGRRKTAMFEALGKVKNELMLLGFISLLLTFGQSYIVRICIPEKAANTMLPCPFVHDNVNHKLNRGEHRRIVLSVSTGINSSSPRFLTEASLIPTCPKSYIARVCIPENVEEIVIRRRGKGGGDHRRKQGHKRLLLSVAMNRSSRSHRFLSEDLHVPACNKGKVPLVSINGLHQLHLFIFFLALCHVFFSAMTMTLGRAKIRGWKEWECETTSSDYEFSNDPARFRLTHQTSFVRQHTSFWNKLPASFYVVSFFRQFFRSVRKADYLAMRHGFISVHLSPGSKFDFQKYIKRALEDDFKVVVSISPTLWASAVIFLFLNVNGWYTLLWISITPLIIILLVGTKLQAIISMMAIEIQQRHAVVQGIPLVQVSDHHFWLGQPHFVLFLIHFTLFQNAFQIIYFLWIWYAFGFDSCFNSNHRLVFVRLCLGAMVQFLCSYITLPLYALVSQMGSQMKESIFDEETAKALKNWRQAAKKKNAKEFENLPAASSSETSPTGMRHLHCSKSNNGPAAAASTDHAKGIETEMQPSASISASLPSSNHQLDLLTGSPE